MSALYDIARQKFLDGDLDWSAMNFKAVCVDAADYTLNLVTHDFLDDVPAGGRVATSGNLAGKTSTSGIADANDITIGGVTGDQFEYIIIIRDSGGADNTKELVAVIDTATGLPFTPNSGDLTITWDNGTNKIFKL